MLKRISTELKICTIIYITAVLYALYSFSKSCNDYFKHINSNDVDFNQGWNFLSRKQDQSDLEWTAIKYLIQKHYFWFLLHHIICESIRQIGYNRVLPLCRLVISTSMVVRNFGLFPLCIILVQPLSFYIFSQIASNKFSIVWTFNLFVLYVLNAFKQIMWEQWFSYHTNLDYLHCYLLMVLILWMNMKCMSYTFEISHKAHILDLLSYCFYLPTLFTGPFIPYNDFIDFKDKDVSKSTSFWNRLKDLLWNLCRFLFWLQFADFFLHYLYVNAAIYYVKWVSSLNSWAFYGYGYAMGQMFHLKYVVSYGLSTTFAAFDFIKVPPTPKCIGRVHVYSFMWKYFDVGLYRFLIRYIYLPTLKTKWLFNSPNVARILCFLFIYVWHGTESYITIWAVFNFFALLMEKFGEWIYTRYIASMAITKKIGQHWVQRISCGICVPLLVFSAISNFYFFAQLEIGTLFVKRVTSGSLKELIILFVILYSGSQVAQRLRQK